MDSKQQVVIQLPKDPGAQNAQNLYAYVVNANGAITETAPFKGGQAALATTAEDLDGRSKVYIAQALPAGIGEDAKSERTLQKMGGYEAVKSVKAGTISVSQLPPIVINPFPFSTCLVTGHVNKNFNIDGKLQNLPLCDVRVHICEVETELRWPFIPINYRRIPDWVISELAQKIVAVQPKPTPPDPIGPVSRLPITTAPVLTQKLNVPLATLTNRQLTPFIKPVNTTQALSADVVTKIQSKSIDTVRQALIDYHDLLYPYFCLWPIYWPWIYTMVEEQVVTTDCNGHFESWLITFGKEHPLNIYIWVEANINGQWVTVYRPPLPCNTKWNYACGSDINIRVTDSRVGPCSCGTKGPADAVWFRSIGWSASALHIEQNTTSTVTVQSATMLNGGCTDIVDLAKGQKISPFGGGLTFKLFVGGNIFNAGVTHYRWKRTMVTDATQGAVSGSTSILTGTVSRPYMVQMSASHYETHYCTLGAEGSGTDIAYRLPHSLVTGEPVSSLQDPADTGRNPTWNDIFFDSAYIDSHSLTDGIWKFELELLKKESNGSFTPVSVDKATFQVSKVNSIDDSQDAPDTYLNLAAGKAASFKINVRIDNAPCVGDIHDAVLNETGALSGPCGFIHYNDTGHHVHLSFEASHPRNFAWFDYGVVKGNNTQPTGIAPSGYVVSSVGGYTLSAGGVFGNDYTVAGLLNGCPGQAAFAENLHVSALATDGTNRLYGYDYSVGDTPYYYDAYDTNAFALSNT
ncbi:MAG: hypothetical protein JST68_01250 [Bacteroidetes bacterium]|nr:hypothetical protein [Bacteroidota bacterium]